MKKIVMLIFALSVWNVRAAVNGDECKPADENPGRLRRVVIEGTYHGTNLFVQNPFDNEKGYCITEVWVNGEECRGLGNQSEFEIDMSLLGIRPGETVEIMIEHGASCGPIIVNPAVLK